MKDSLKNNKYLKVIKLFNLPVLEIFNPANLNHKRYKINFCGIKFTFKTKALAEQVKKYNNELNKENLSLNLPECKKHILFIVSELETTGGVETRILQYIQKLSNAGWNVSILCENNNNKKLLEYTNFCLIFNAQNVNECLNALIDKYNIKIAEFHFKSSNILKNINIEELKKKVKIGCVFHNLGVKNKRIINNFDYKIMVSQYMYENFYKKDIENAHIIQNSIDTNKYNNFPVWEYKSQKTALLISRISNDKLKSIECFIKYCQKNNMEYKIAGVENYSDIIRNKLIKKYKLPPETFIGHIDTMEYLKHNIDNILFTAGLGLVVLESLYLGYPCLCCSDYAGKNYSFVTADNVMLFDNFTIRRKSPVSKLGKKVYNLDRNKISDYCVRDYIFQNRDLNVNFERYSRICSLQDYSITF